MARLKVLLQVGQQINRLKFLGYSGTNSHGHRRGNFICDCGKEVELLVNNVLNMVTRSCGCFRKEITGASRNNLRHGLSRDRIYFTWHSMISRCFFDTHKNYDLYGGRGITVCEEWQDVRKFNEWAIKNGYKDHLQLDRIDSNGNYEPGNCRFVTSMANNNNRRNNHHITYKGETKTLSQWADHLGMRAETIRFRLKKNWPLEKALVPIPRE